MSATEICVGRESCCVQLRHCERKRSNPESLRGKTLDCFVARAPRNDVERAVCLNLSLVPRTLRSTRRHRAALVAWDRLCAATPLALPLVRDTRVAGVDHGFAERSPHFASNCNSCVQEVLIRCDLEVIARLERGPGPRRLTDRVHRDQRTVIETPLPKVPK
ncbi:hypothetical protein CWO91_14830 [Bradyrhizobium genosp. SA-3]|nr:hypothetical protein CWO91_14830 [Bradyrhizobium genosp. SA-3]